MSGFELIAVLVGLFFYLIYVLAEPYCSARAEMYEQDAEKVRIQNEKDEFELEKSKDAYYAGQE